MYSGYSGSRRGARRLHRSARSGAVVVEMAILSLPLFILLMGTINTGHILHVRQMFIAVSREGARVYTNIEGKLFEDQVAADPSYTRQKGVKYADDFVKEFLDEAFSMTAGKPLRSQIQVEFDEYEGMQDGVLKVVSKGCRVRATYASCLIVGNFLNMWPDGADAFVAGETIARVEDLLAGASASAP